MKKYSKSEVMKMAWELYKAHGECELVFSFSEALKQSWYIAKREARLESAEKPAKVAEMAGSAKQVSWAEGIKARIREAVEKSVIAWERKAYEAFLDIVESVEYAGDVIAFWSGYRGTLDDASLICMMSERQEKTESQRAISERMDSLLAGSRVSRTSLSYASSALYDGDCGTDEELTVRYCSHLSSALSIAQCMRDTAIEEAARKRSIELAEKYNRRRDIA